MRVKRGSDDTHLDRGRLLTRLVAACLLTLSLFVLAGLATASSERSQLRDAVQATARFHDVGAAEAAGYAELRDAQGIACIELPGVGGMGVHFVKGALVDDAVFDPVTPEALVYGPRPNGKLKLVALEYIVFKAAWDAEHQGPPSLFGRAFDLTPAPNRFGIPAFYALHAWIWKPNPSGLLEPWNPRVEC
jgi:hypothetical protein